MGWIWIVFIGAMIYLIVSDYLFLKKDGAKMAKLRIYQETMTAQWIICGLLLIAWAMSGLPWRALVQIDVASNVDYDWTFIVGVLTGTLLLIIFLSIKGKKQTSENGTETSQPTVGNIHFLLPQTKKERWVFLAVSMTAAICEELLFRAAFMMLLIHMPWALSIQIVTVVGGIFFGLAHYYQGWKGMLGTGIVGYMMCKLYIATGSLFFPMIIHFILDAKFCLTPNQKMAPSPHTS